MTPASPSIRQTWRCSVGLENTPPSHRASDQGVCDQKHVRVAIPFVNWSLIAPCRVRSESADHPCLAATSRTSPLRSWFAGGMGQSIGGNAPWPVRGRTVAFCSRLPVARLVVRCA